MLQKESEIKPKEKQVMRMKDNFSPPAEQCPACSQAAAFPQFTG